MKPLSREERLFVLELVTDIASEAAQNPNVVWMIEVQEELVEKLYRKMVALLEEPGDDVETEAGPSSAGKSGAQRPRKAAKRTSPAKKPR